MATFADLQPPLQGCAEHESDLHFDSTPAFVAECASCGGCWAVCSMCAMRMTRPENGLSECPACPGAVLELRMLTQ